MIENHPSIEIEKFSNDVKNALQRNSDIEEYQHLGEIGDLTSFSKGVVYMTTVSVYIKEESYRSLSDRATITKAIYTALAEYSKCKDVFSLGNYIVAVYDTPFKSDIDAALDCVGKVNALFNLVNKIYSQAMHSRMEYGIGMNYGKVLLVNSIGGEAPQFAWSGDVLNAATTLSEQASVSNRVFASYTIYNNLKDDYQKLFKRTTFKDYYEATPVNIAMDKWINANV